MFKRYGAILILLLMWVGTASAHYYYFMQREKQEAETHQVEFKQDEANTAWLSDTFENHQSEYAQLFFQGILFYMLADYIFRKQEEDIKKAVHAAMDERNKS